MPKLSHLFLRNNRTVLTAVTHTIADKKHGVISFALAMHASIALPRCRIVYIIVPALRHWKYCFLTQLLRPSAHNPRTIGSTEFPDESQEEVVRDDWW